MPILLLVLCVTAIDQVTKFYVQKTLQLGTSIPVIEDVFHITYILNPGAAFGILEHKTVFFLGIAAFLLLALLYVFPRIPKELTLLRCGIGLMAGGALGNVIDRARTGMVVDFFDFRIWPIFNVADIAICTGVAAILYTLVFSSHFKD